MIAAMGGEVDTDYITFADANVEAICASNWGKNGKLTYKQAARVTSLGTVFQGNTTITSFDELQYFTGLTEIGTTNNSGDSPFSGCTALASVRIPSTVTKIRGYAFYGCTALTSVGSLTNITYIGTYAFYNCTRLALVINCPGLTFLGGSSLRNSGVTKLLDLGEIAQINTYTCSGCTDLAEIHLPTTCTSIGRCGFEVNNTAATAMADASRTNPPSYGTSCFRAAKVSAVYVPSTAVAAYQSSWSALSSKIQANPT